jgi:hypothetical protein
MHLGWQITFIKNGFKAIRNEALRILSENLKEIDAIIQKPCVMSALTDTS